MIQCIMESTHDRTLYLWKTLICVAGAEQKETSQVYGSCFTKYIGWEVTPMTAYEIISILIGILALLMSFGSLVIALLAFLDKRNKRK